MNQLHVPPLTKINKAIIILYVGTFLVNSILSQVAGISLTHILGLSLNGLKSGLIFQLITYSIVDESLMSVLFSSLIIWFIGSELEGKWSQAFYLKFIVFTLLVSGFVYLIISLFASQLFSSIPLHGISSLTYALLIAYAMIYSERMLTFMLIFPMKAKYFCLLLVGIEFYMGVFSTHAKASWAHLSACAFAFLYLRYKSMQARGVSFKSLYESNHSKRSKSKFTVIDGGKDEDGSKPPKYWQ